MDVQMPMAALAVHSPPVERKTAARTDSGLFVSLSASSLNDRFAQMRRTVLPASARVNPSLRLARTRFAAFFIHATVNRSSQGYANLHS
jgi:hypothetical protein